jgi:hypothetical protein
MQYTSREILFYCWHVIFYFSTIVRFDLLLLVPYFETETSLYSSHGCIHFYSIILNFFFFLQWLITSLLFLEANNTENKVYFLFILVFDF